LSSNDSLSLLVCPATTAAAVAGVRAVPRPRARATFATLAAALSAARPGDTVRLVAGVLTPPEGGFIMRTSVQLLGAGTASTRLAAGVAGAPTLVAAAPRCGVLVRDLTVDAAPGAPAIRHESGSLTVASCRVRGGAGPLAFLHPPLLTLAARPPPGLPAALAASAGIFGGRLTVAGSAVVGAAGGAAVGVGAGGGRLADVRMLPLTRGALMWARVDSEDGAGGGGGVGREVGECACAEPVF